SSTPFSPSYIMCCFGCCTSKPPISKVAPPNPADSPSVTQQPGSSKGNSIPARSVEQRTTKESDCANYENVSIMK
ncbi:hypothetical protein PMAYCL1PPCAC_07631, partial [Pristionchus mayeri]